MEDRESIVLTIETYPFLFFIMFIKTLGNIIVIIIIVDRISINVHLFVVFLLFNVLCLIGRWDVFAVLHVDVCSLVVVVVNVVVMVQSAFFKLFIFIPIFWWLLLRSFRWMLLSVFLYNCMVLPIINRSISVKSSKNNGNSSNS